MTFHDRRPIGERRDDAPPEPQANGPVHEFRPVLLIRLGGVAIGLVVAAPALLALATGSIPTWVEFDSSADLTGILLPIFFTIAGLYFAWRSWVFGAEVDDAEFRFYGLLYSQTFPLESLGGIVYEFSQRSRYLVVKDIEGNIVANAESLRLLSDHERLISLVRSRSGRLPWERE